MVGLSGDRTSVILMYVLRSFEWVPHGLIASICVTRVCLPFFYLLAGKENPALGGVLRIQSESGFASASSLAHPLQTDAEKREGGGFSNGNIPKQFKARHASFRFPYGVLPKVLDRPFARFRFSGWVPRLSTRLKVRIVPISLSVVAPRPAACSPAPSRSSSREIPLG
jgi:hypothetical protein